MDSISILTELSKKVDNFEEVASQFNEMDKEGQAKFISEAAAFLGMDESLESKVASGEMTLEQDERDIQEQGIAEVAATSEMGQEEPDLVQESAESWEGQYTAGALRMADNALFGIPSKMGSAGVAAMETIADVFSDDISNESLAEQFRQNYGAMQELSKQYLDAAEKANPAVQTIAGISGYIVQGVGIAKALPAMAAAQAEGNLLTRTAAVGTESAVFDGLRNLIDLSSAAFEQGNFDAKKIIEDTIERTRKETTTATAFAGGLGAAGAAARGLMRGSAWVARKATGVFSALGLSENVNQKLLYDNYDLWKGKSKEEVAQALGKVKTSVLKTADNMLNTFADAHRSALDEGAVYVADAMKFAGETLDATLTNFAEVAAKEANGPELAKAANYVVSTADAIHGRAIQSYGRELSDIAQIADVKGKVPVGEVASNFFTKLEDAGVATIGKNGKISVTGGSKKLDDLFNKLAVDELNFEDAKNLLTDIGAVAKWGKSNLDEADRAVLELWGDLSESLKNTLGDDALVRRYEDMQTSYRQILETTGSARQLKKSFKDNMIGEDILRDPMDDQLLDSFASELSSQVNKTEKLMVSMKKQNVRGNSLISFEPEEISLMGDALVSMRKEVSKVKNIKAASSARKALTSGDDASLFESLKALDENAQTYTQVKKAAGELLGYKHAAKAIMDPSDKKLVNTALESLPTDLHPKFRKLTDSLNKAQRLQGLRTGLINNIDKAAQMDEASADIIRLAAQIDPNIEKLASDQKVFEAYLKSSPASVKPFFSAGRSFVDEFAIGSVAKVLGAPWASVLMTYQALKAPATLKAFADSTGMNLRKVQSMHQTIKAVERYMANKQNEKQE